MQLLPIVFGVLALSLAGCENYDGLHLHRHVYRRPAPGEIRPVSRMAVTADQTAAAPSVARNKQPQRRPPQASGATPPIGANGRPLLPKFERTPVIDIEEDLQTLGGAG